MSEPIIDKLKWDNLHTLIIGLFEANNSVRIIRRNYESVLVCTLLYILQE